MTDEELQRGLRDPTPRLFSLGVANRRLTHRNSGYRLDEAEQEPSAFSSEVPRSIVERVLVTASSASILMTLDIT